MSTILIITTFATQAWSPFVFGPDFTGSDKEEANRNSGGLLDSSVSLIYYVLQLTTYCTLKGSLH